MKIISPVYSVTAVAVDIIFVRPDGAVLRERQLVTQPASLTSVQGEQKYCIDWEEFIKDAKRLRVPACKQGVFLI